jgi:hypothetical protein
VGNTIVTDRYVRLTFDAQSKAGGLWSSIPVTYPDWEMHVNFKVHGASKQLFGDGFAIWYAKEPKITGENISSDESIEEPLLCFSLVQDLSSATEIISMEWQSSWIPMPMTNESIM